MPRNDDAVLAVGTGTFYKGPVDTPLPADLTAPGASWEEIGHTSIDNIMAMDSEGGDVTTLGTLQNPTLRTTQTPIVDSFTFNLEQWDTPSLKLFFGSNAVVDPDTGAVQVPSKPVATTCAWLVVLEDGENTIAFHAPKAQIFRGDNMEISDTQSIAALPLKVTPLQSGTNTYPYQITPLGEGESSSE